MQMAKIYYRVNTYK